MAGCFLRQRGASVFRRRGEMIDDDGRDLGFDTEAGIRVLRWIEDDEVSVAIVDGGSEREREREEGKWG